MNIIEIASEPKNDPSTAGWINGLSSDRHRDPTSIHIDLTAKGVSLRKRTEQMLGEFYCFLSVPLADLFDLKDLLVSKQP